MGVLILILVGLCAAGCYAPALRDCTVSCEAPSDCATGQVCGGDGLCAAPEVAGSCAGLQPDAGVGEDAGVDAAPGPTTVSLRVRVGGRGSVVIDGRGTCSSERPQEGDCMYDIALGVLQRARALPIQLDHVFESWAMGPCVGQLAICTFRAVEATTIEAKFKRTDD
jgi:hypothetical protein